MNLRRYARAFVGILFGGFIVWGGAARAAAPEDVFDAMRAKRAIPPTSAPELALPSVNGGTLQLAELRGKAVILGFFHTT